jgi:hypothetical protein
MMNTGRKHIKEKVFLILIFFISVQSLFGVTLPSSPYISKASVTSNNTQSDGDGIAQPPAMAVLGDAPAFPPDPGEVPLGDSLPLCVVALGYLIYKNRKVNG